jgi:glutathione S-transferase
MIFGVVSDIKGAASRHCYGSGDKNAVIEIFNSMEAVQKFIGDKKFIVGDYFTWEDFFVFEQIELFDYISEGAFTKKYPALGAYHMRIASLPKFSQYYNSAKFMKKSFNNKISKIN